MSSTVSVPPSMLLPPQQQVSNQGAVPSMNLNALRSQIEFYFSPQNLAKDAFLQSQLKASDHIGAVPMHTICNFPKVRQIYAFLNNIAHLPLHMLPMADPRLVRMALQGSSVVTVSQDGAWISPNQSISLKPVPAPAPTTNPTDEPKTVSSTPSSPSSQATASSSLGVPTHPLPPAADDNTNRTERNIVILRDIPSTVSTEDVHEIFSSASISPIAVRPDVGDTWFVTFETEELAVKALASVRDKSLGNHPIRGCLKSDVKPAPTSDGASATSSTPMANSAPLPSMPMAYPVVFPFVPMQQSHPAYGYVYSIPPQQGPIHVRAQPPPYYPYAYTNQGFLRPMVGGYPTNPPPNVYFQGRPAPHHPHGTDKLNQNAVNGKLNTRKWQNRKKQTGPSDQQIPAHPTKGETLDAEVSHKLHDKKIQKKKQQRLQQQQGQQTKRKSQETNIDLGAEHFPALGSSSTKSAAQTENKLPVGGYAQALLKKPEKPLVPVPVEPVDVTLSTQMSKMAFSHDDTSGTAHDAW